MLADHIQAFMKALKPPLDPRLTWGAAAALLAWLIVSRLTGLDQLLIWHDEVFSLARVLGYSGEEIQRTLFSGQLLTPEEVLRLQRPDPQHGWPESLAAFVEHPEHAPLYYALGRLALGLPLDPIVALRGLAACCGVLLVPAVYALMRALFGRGPAPWIAAALVICSPLQLLYAQEARQYALWLLLTALSCLVLVDAWRRNRPLAWSLYALISALGLYTHLLFGILIAAQAVWVLGLRCPGLNPRRCWQGVRPWALATAAALIAFLPWIWVLLINQERFVSFTSWMQRPIGWDEIARAWADHLTATFVDLTPSLEPLGWWLLLPIGWMVWRFVRFSPRASAYLLLAIALAHIAAVLGPDLIKGGSRSQHVRYALPALLALELMVAWWIGQALLQAPGSRERRLGLIALVGLLGLGLVSQIRIKQAESWSNKHFSAQDRLIAQILNIGERPLVLASPSGVSAGELIAVCHYLKPHVRLWGEPLSGDREPPTGYQPVVVLTPSARLRQRLHAYSLRPLAGTWQWQGAEPKAK